MRQRIRCGLRAGAIASVLSGAPSTTWALATRRPLMEGTRAAGTLVLGEHAAPRRLALVGVAVHEAISLGWGVALAFVLPRRAPVRWGAVAGLVIAAVDLGVVGRRYPRIRALPALPQVADHIAYGATVGFVISRGR